MSNLRLGIILCISLKTCLVFGSIIRMHQENFAEKVKPTINIDNNNALPFDWPDYWTFNPLLNSPRGNDTFRFASYYADHMVLQRAPQRAGLWGYAGPAMLGKEVTVTLMKENGENGGVFTTSVKQGPELEAVWSVMLDAQPAGGPYVVKTTVGTQTLELKDVYFGEVWVCSGQSNMQFTVAQMSDAAFEEELADTLPLVRIFSPAQNTATKPLTDLAKIELQWTVASANPKALAGFSAVCFVYGRYLNQFLGVPVGLVKSDWGGTPVEAWSSTDALKQCGLATQNVEGPGEHSVLYNAMIHPLLNMTIKGAIWYQGEANTGAPDNYNCTFPAMIEDWRKKWQEGTKKETADDFPFGFVQLGPLAYKAGFNVTRGYPDIRWHQTADQGYVPNSRMPNTFMATAVDLTDDDSPYGSVHIRDKLSVGRRLVLSGLSLVYGVEGIKYQGPRVTDYVLDKAHFMLRLVFDSKKDPITVQHRDDGFELCCTNDKSVRCPDDGSTTKGRWVTTPIIAHDANSVTLSWSRCEHQSLTGIRYLWRVTPCKYKECPVYSLENELPATPFVTHGLLLGEGEE